MKPSSSSPTSAPLLAFGAHPDDIEFGVGGIVARETQAGRPAQFIVCSRGEAGTNGTPAQRVREAEAAAKLLGASVQFLELDGDAHLEVRNAHALALARIIRAVRPTMVLAPSTEPNQHPDHWRLGLLVRDATRLARYGNVAELKQLTPHAVSQLFFYAVSPSATPGNVSPVIIDISPAPVLEAWKAAMEAHASQLRTRNYVELQLTRARTHGLDAGVGHAQLLYPNDPLVFHSLSDISRGARRH
ncbi:MAG: PIG-L family deacetylase [Candidatus Didemnitutus sp.]|nr:PIG-L family deacetylase [Candidatus Didemnitutus sp.]